MPSCNLVSLIPINSKLCLWLRLLNFVVSRFWKFAFDLASWPAGDDKRSFFIKWCKFQLQAGMQKEQRWLPLYSRYLKKSHWQISQYVKKWRKIVQRRKIKEAANFNGTFAQLFCFWYAHATRVPGTVSNFSNFISGHSLMCIAIQSPGQRSNAGFPLKGCHCTEQPIRQGHIIPSFPVASV